MEAAPSGEATLRIPFGLRKMGLTETDRIILGRTRALVRPWPCHLRWGLPLKEWQCYLTDEHLCGDLEINRKAVYRSFRHLEQLGILARTILWYGGRTHRVITLLKFRAGLEGKSESPVTPMAATSMVPPPREDPADPSGCNAKASQNAKEGVGNMDVPEHTQTPQIEAHEWLEFTARSRAFLDQRLKVVKHEAGVDWDKQHRRFLAKKGRQYLHSPDAELISALDAWIIIARPTGGPPVATKSMSSEEQLEARVNTLLAAYQTPEIKPVEMTVANNDGDNLIDLQESVSGEDDKVVNH